MHIMTQFPCIKYTQYSAMFKFNQRTCPSLLDWCKKQTWIPLLLHFVFVAWAHFIHWWLVFLAYCWGLHADLYVVLFTEFNFIQLISSVCVSHCHQIIWCSVMALIENGSVFPQCTALCVGGELFRATIVRQVCR